MAKLSPEGGTDNSRSAGNRELLQIAFADVQSAAAELEELHDGLRGDSAADPRQLATEPRRKLKSAVDEFLKLTGFTAARLASELSTSNQTVMRWRRADTKGEYYLSRPSDIVLQQWKNLLSHLLTDRTLNLREQLGLWNWRDLVELDDSADTFRVWIVSNESFGESVSAEESDKLMKRVSDSDRSVAYIYVYDKGSEGESSFQIIQDYWLDHQNDYKRSEKSLNEDSGGSLQISAILGVGLPEEPRHFGGHSLYEQTQAVHYQQRERQFSFIALPFDSELQKSPGPDLDVLWKRMPNKTAHRWHNNFFAPLWRAIAEKLALLPSGEITSCQHESLSIKGAELHVAVYKR